MYHIKLVNQGVTHKAGGGETLAQACADAGFPLDLVCGGRGTCGKCAVVVESGGTRETVLACRTIVDRDMAVYLEETQLSRAAAIITEGRTAHKLALSPAVSKRCFTRGELMPGHCGAYLETGSPALLRSFSRLIADHSVGEITFVSYRGEVVAVEAGDTTSMLYGGAIDIGTTSVVLYAYDLNSGKLLRTESTLNGQIVRGADVISRILHTQQAEDGLDELTGHIRDTVNGLLAAAESDIPGYRAHLYHLVLCGNSTMQHLFLGLDPSGLAADPFVNVTAGLVRCAGAEVGMDMAAGGRVDFLPLLGGFVGADTASVLLTLPVDERRCLMVDLGTNGEIAAGGGGSYKVASTACGPALEGGNIACGMRGMDGAIEKISIDGDALSFRVIGGGEAKGLCGSAIIDAVAELRSAGVIDESGRLLPADEFRAAHPGSTLDQYLGEAGEYNPAFFFTRGEQSVYLAQHDVRQIQLAKSSIYSGCVALLEASGLALEDLDALYLAGAFGNYIDVDHALEIGLLPPIPRERIVSIGNGAGQGVQLCLLDSAQLDRCQALPASIEHLELATSPRFMEEYIMNMNF
ncbi:ASKHA domain-containing protein [Lawsonibacter faecis]|uniref:DUF4445 domain-containing protein n=1 Tax=Lawsonibacter faecis TaxID=2763052 RepID=A0A8J6MD81_9FIRM|nr:ASKHA domain-containing protein [Lawsonibacter faecis]MBC5737855.1 DUF4445 domain-containing protein [Lawsonibacter faecis]